MIEREASLLVASEQTFREVFRIDVRTNCEAVSVSPKTKTVDLRDVATGVVTTETYDKLVLSPGAPSLRPPIPGIDLPGIFQVRTVPDVRAIREWIERGTKFLAGMYNYSGMHFAKPPRRAVVIGGGFIVENSVQNFPDSGGKQRPIVSTRGHAIIRLFGRSIWGVAYGLNCRDPASSFGEQGEHQFDCA